MRQEPIRLGDILQEVIRELGLEDKINQARVVEAWGEIAGPQINAVTQRVWFKEGTLYVRVSSPTWRQELHLSRRMWCERLNKHLGKHLVNEITFR